MNCRRRFLLLSIFLSGLLSLFYSCKKEDFDFDNLASPEFDWDGAMPLVHSVMTVEDMLPKGSHIVEDSNHLLTLIYETELASLKAEDYISIPDQNMSFDETNLMIVVPTGTSATLPFDRSIPFVSPQSGQHIDSIRIKSGNIHIAYQSNINHNGTVQVTLPNVRKNGFPLQTNFEHLYQGSLPVTGTINIDLSGYTIGLVADTAGTTTLAVNFIININGDNNPNNSPYSFHLDASLTNLKFAGIFGYLGQYTYNLADSLSINIFHNNLEGYIEFSDLKLLISTYNSVGMPLQLNINQLKAYSSVVQPYVVDIAAHSGFPNPLNFPSPDLSELGQEADTTFLISTSNSNLNQAIHISPQYLFFDVTGKSNPDTTASQENFVLDTSHFKVKLKVELPFFASVENFQFQDTLDFKFEDIEEIQEFSFKLVTRNGFPLEVKIQAYFADSNNQVLDSLIYGNDPYIVHAAPVSGPPDYRVITQPPPPLYTYSPQPLDRMRLARLNNCRKMILKAGLNTTNLGVVKIYSDYDIDLRLGARIKARYQP